MDFLIKVLAQTERGSPSLNERLQNWKTTIARLDLICLSLSALLKYEDSRSDYLDLIFSGVLAG